MRLYGEEMKVSTASLLGKLQQADYAGGNFSRQVILRGDSSSFLVREKICYRVARWCNDQLMRLYPMASMGFGRR